MPVLYVLISEDGKYTYTGSTINLNRRIREHNAGKVRSSKPHRPYKLLLAESFETLKEARFRELFYKSTTGRRELKKIIKA